MTIRYFSLGFLALFVLTMRYSSVHCTGFLENTSVRFAISPSRPQCCGYTRVVGRGKWVGMGKMGRSLLPKLGTSG